MIYAKPELNVLAYRLSHLLDDARRNTTPDERTEVLVAAAVAVLLQPGEATTKGIARCKEVLHAVRVTL
jgi:hypothetical protein